MLYDFSPSLKLEDVQNHFKQIDPDIHVAYFKNKLSLAGNPVCFAVLLVDNEALSNDIHLNLFS